MKDMEGRTFDRDLDKVALAYLPAEDSARTLAFVAEHFPHCVFGYVFSNSELEVRTAFF